MVRKRGIFGGGLMDFGYSAPSGPAQQIGKHGDLPDEMFNKRQLAMGIRVEMEHTGDREIAKRIAKDHLMEIPDYYTRLHKMESE